MKAQDPKLQIRILVPPDAQGAFMRYEPEQHAELSKDEIVVVRRLTGRSHMTYMLDPIQLVIALRSFRPDIVLIEEDPHSVIGVEVTALVRVFCRNAKIAIFIWDNLARRPAFPIYLLKRLLTSYTLSKCSLVICGNTEGHALLRTSKRYNGAAVVLPQLGVGVVAERSPDRDGSMPIVGFIGRLIPEKGVLLLLNALLQLRNLTWKIVIVGAGPLEEELRTIWQPLLGERLVQIGPVSHSAVTEHLKSLDIFVLPSYATPSWKEQFGLTLAQAMMVGIACIGSSSGAIPEVLGGTGVVFQEGNELALVAALEGLLTSPERRRTLATAARSRAMAEYSTMIVAAKYTDALKQIFQTN
jgi:glycosyltransferase involved in cell wall biosynthesis